MQLSLVIVVLNGIRVKSLSASKTVFIMKINYKYEKEYLRLK